MAQIGDSKGEYRGGVYRDDAALKAWLAKRPAEAALEPDLPIIDPHHHFWDTPHRGRYLLPELLADIGGGHNIVSTVFLECRAMYRKAGPREMAALGEVEFVNGIAAMSASGSYGPCRVAEGIVGGGDLTVGARVRELLEAEIAAAGGRLRGMRHGVAWDTHEAVDKYASRVVPLHQVMDPKFREGLAQLAPLGLSFEVMAVSSATAGRDRSCARVSGHHHHPQSCRRHARRRAICRPPRRKILAGWRKDITELAKCPNVYCKLGGIGMVSVGFDFHERDVPPVVGGPRRGVAALYRALHRGVRRQPLHVREQLPAGQAVLRLHRAVERVQAHHRRRIGGGEDGAVQRHRGARVSSDRALIPYRRRWRAWQEADSRLPKGRGVPGRLRRIGGATRIDRAIYRERSR